MIIDHAGLQVSDLEASRKFYTAALAPLGTAMVFDPDGHNIEAVCHQPGE
jgi:catechol-2,3-dioxygenase